MKRLLFLFCLLLALTAQAQDSTPTKTDSVEVAFAVTFPKTSSLTAAQRQELGDKIEAVLARTQAAGLTNSQFAVVPDVKVTSRQATQGTIEAMTLVEGELTLTAKNRFTGKAFNAQTIPLREVVSGVSVPDPTLTLIRSINIKDKRFVRFVRTSINRIEDYYQNNHQ